MPTVNYPDSIKTYPEDTPVVDIFRDAQQKGFDLEYNYESGAFDAHKPEKSQRAEIHQLFPHCEPVIDRGNDLPPAA